MSIWSNKRHKADELDALDDVTVNRLLDGCYRGETPELLATSQLVEQVRAFAGEPAPRPSAALTRIMSGSSLAGGDVPAATRATSGLRRQRPSIAGVPTVATSVALALVVVIVVAGSARLLPGPAQDLVAAIVRAITPFDFPQQREPDAVLSRSRQPGVPPPSQRSSATPAASPPTKEPGTIGDRATAGEGDAARPVPGPAPATSTTVTPRPAPVIGGTAPPGTPTTRRAPGAVTGPVPPGPPPSAPGPHRLSADLRGGQSASGPVGHGSVTLDTNPGKNELCLTLTVSATAQVTSVHLHAGSVGANGPVVANFTPPPVAGTSRTCVTVTDQLMKDILRDPGDFYVDVHTVDPLNGTLRGQLTR